MIKYSKRWYGMTLLFQLFGSAIPRALPFALYGGLVAFALSSTCAQYLEDNWRHPFPYQAIAFIVGFLVSFRCARNSKSEVRPVRSRDATRHCAPRGAHRRPRRRRAHTEKQSLKGPLSRASARARVLGRRRFGGPHNHVRIPVDDSDAPSSGPRRSAEHTMLYLVTRRGARTRAVQSRGARSWLRPGATPPTSMRQLP